MKGIKAFYDRGIKCMGMGGLVHKVLSLNLPVPGLSPGGVLNKSI